MLRVEDQREIYNRWEGGEKRNISSRCHVLSPGRIGKIRESCQEEDVL